MKDRSKPNRVREHYSIEVYRDSGLAERFDREKFGTPVGAVFRKYQEGVIRSFLPSVDGRRILDLGAGTGRISLPLSDRKAVVFAADASVAMLKVAREKAWLQMRPVHCICADAHHLPFPDGSFHAAVSLRMLMHVRDWERAVAEICRVSGKYLIVDFPPRSGFAGFAPVVHPVIRLFRSGYQPYRIFSIHLIKRKLESLGYRVIGIDRHLVLPFGLHRLIGSPAFTCKTETLLRRLGLTDILGAPVTFLAEKKGDA
ncbi:methyltransferase domain-containing protein [bacterium]|nr:methyltransferase domain-containing protein [candidate division CSSED10-310 bacterium]